MSPTSRIEPTGRPGASRDAIPAQRPTIVNASDSTNSAGRGNACEISESCRPGNAEDHPTLTEIVLDFLDKHCA